MECFNRQLIYERKCIPQFPTKKKCDTIAASKHRGGSEILIGQFLFIEIMFLFLGRFNISDLIN
jgi:hypothetical protein